MDHQAGEEVHAGGHGFARQRKPKTDPLCCPICGVTLRSNEIDQHFALEVERLDKILKPKRNLLSVGGYGTGTDRAVPGTSAGGSGSSSAALANGHRSMEDNNSDVASASNPDECWGWGTYQKIKNNRQARLKVNPILFQM